MPISLHPDCRKRVVEAATQGIPRITAKNGMFLDRMSCLLAFIEGEMALPKTGKIREQLSAYIDEHPFLSFCTDFLGFELWVHGKYQTDSQSLKLIELEGYKDAALLADRLVTQLESLPWRYTWSLKLPEAIGAEFRSLVSDFEISPRLRLMSPTSDTDASFPLLSDDEDLNKRLHPKGLLSFTYEKDQRWETDGAYVQIELDGYIGQYGSTLPADEAKRTVKALFGLGIALRLFEVDFSLAPAPTERLPFGLKKQIYVHRLHQGSWKIDNRIELAELEWRALGSTKFHKLDGALDTQEKRVDWALSRLFDLKAVFSAGDDANSILLASQWLFDSYMGTDELLSFVQAMVVLEILLGDKAASDQIGLGELLRNRCAYLISDTHAERAEHLKDFNEIYKVRSKIVHQGKHRLNAEERALFNKLRWMCRRVIFQEVKLLRATIEKGKR